MKLLLVQHFHLEAEEGLNEKQLAFARVLRQLKLRTIIGYVDVALDTSIISFLD